MSNSRSFPRSLKALLPACLTTSRLTLQLLDNSPAHYTCILDTMNSPTAHRNMGDFGIRTPEEFDKLNAATRLSPTLFPDPVDIDTDVFYVIRLGGKDGPLIGGVSLAQRGPNVAPDEGWGLLEEYHGKGYATEAATELLRLIREDLGIKEVMAWPGNKNLASQNVAKRVGFVEGGTAKGEDGEESATVYVLPGMKFESGTTIKLYGE